MKKIKACSTPGCPVVIKRQSRSVDTKKHCCGKCKGTLIEIEVPDTKNKSLSKLTHTPKQKRKPSGFSLFVQQNSKIVRERLMRESLAGKVLQKDVMKECGRLWRHEKDKASE